MPRTLPEVVAEIYEQAGRDVPRHSRKPDWWVRAQRFLVAFARGDRSTFRRTPQQKRAMMQALLKHLQEWKGPRARALKKELRDDHGHP